MTIPYRARPGAGFVLVAVVLAASIGFFAWGARTPALEEVWRLRVELEIGEHTDLSRRDRDLLQDTLVRHPGFVESLLDGAPVGLISANNGGLVQARHAYAVRRSSTGRAMLTVTPARSLEGAIRVTARAAGATHAALADRREAFSWELPDNGPFPQLIEIELERSKVSGVRPTALISFQVLP